MTGPGGGGGAGVSEADCGSLSQGGAAQIFSPALWLQENLKTQTELILQRLGVGA